MDLETYQRLVQAQGASLEAARPPVASPDIDPAALSSTVGRAVGGIKDNFGRTAGVVGRLTDSPELVQYGEDLSAAGTAHAMGYGRAPTPYYSDVKDADGAYDWLQETVGGAIVSTAPVIGAALTPAIFRLGKTALAAATLTGFGMNVGEAQGDLERASPGNPENDWNAIKVATAMAVPDMVGGGYILSPIIERTGKEALTAKLLKEGIEPLRVSKMVETADLNSYMSHTLKSSFVEGTVETGQEGLKMGMISEMTDTALPEKAPEMLVNAFVGGAGAGASGATGVAALEGTGEAAAKVATPIRNKITEKIQESKLLAFAGASGVQKLKPYAKHSASMKKFVDMLVHDQSGQTATGATVSEQQNLNIGRQMSLIEQSGLMAMPDEQINAEMDAYAKGLRDTPAQKALALVFEDIEARGVQEKLLDQGLPNYLSLHTDLDRIEANRDQFIADITPYYTDKLGNTRDSEGKLYAEKMLEGYIKALETQDDGSNLPRVDRGMLEENEFGDMVVKEKYRYKGDEKQIKYDIGQGQTTPKAKQLEGKRFWKKVPQHILNKYAREQKGKDKVKAIRDYVELAEHRLASASNFGADGEKATYLFANAIKELASQGIKLPKHIISRGYDIVDAHNGVLNLPSDPTIRNAIGTANAVTNWAKLPLSGISSVVEGILPAIQGEMATMLKGIFPMIQQNVTNILDGATKQVPSSEMSKLASELNITFKAATNTIAERTNDAMLSNNVAKWSEFYYKWNGQTPLLHAYRVGAVVQGQEIVKRNLLTMAGGINPKSQKFAYYQAQLRALGIDIETREQAMEMYAPQGEAQRAWADERTKLAVRRFVDMSHFEPTAFNTSLWMHDGNFRAFAGLKKYASALTNNLMPQIARKFNSNYTGGGLHAGGIATALVASMAAMLVFGTAMDWTKRQLRGVGNKADNRTLLQKFMDSATLAWMPLPASLTYDIYDSVRYGRSPTNVLAGPALGMVDDTMKTIHDLQENPEDGAIWARLVYQQTFLNSFKAWWED